MEQEYPFSEGEVGEIKQIVKYTLSGYKMSNLSDRESIIKSTFDLFLIVAGTEHADVYQLPYSGGVLDQPFKTAKMWALFKNEMAAFIAKENKKQAQKMKSRRK